MNSFHRVSILWASFSIEVQRMMVYRRSALMKLCDVEKLAETTYLTSKLGLRIKYSIC